MEVLLNLNNAQNSQELQMYIVENHITIIDNLSQINHAELLKHKKKIRSLSLKASLFTELDYSISENVAVINGILATAIRFGDNFLFEIFFRILEENELEISNLLKASSLYLIGARTSENIFAFADEIHEKLEQAFLDEEDNNKNVIASLLHYYQFFVKNFLEFAPGEVEKVNTKIKKLQKLQKYFFNQDDIIDEVLQVELSYESNPLEQIYSLIDDFLGRTNFIVPADCKFIIENGTSYCLSLGNPPYNVDAILQLNRAIYYPIKDDNVFYSLQRGVRVPDEEIQLYCYMYAFGNMHRAKLNEVFNYLPEEIGKHRVIDWGCGQGIGSLMYLEKLEDTNKQDSCEEAILIEPSPIALQRASFHVKHRAKRTITCNKDIDSISNSDFIKSNGKTTVHIFSNILDVELFSLNHLIGLIKNNCSGINYFIITSPYIYEPRISRIRTFINQFNTYDGYRMHYSSDAKKGEWICNWTKFIRVFQAQIN
jgi:hypothetical protein